MWYKLELSFMGPGHDDPVMLKIQEKVREFNSTTHAPIKAKVLEDLGMILNYNDRNGITQPMLGLVIGDVYHYVKPTSPAGQAKQRDAEARGRAHG